MEPSVFYFNFHLFDTNSEKTGYLSEQLCTYPAPDVDPSPWFAAYAVRKRIKIIYDLWIASFRSDKKAGFSEISVNHGISNRGCTWKRDTCLLLLSHASFAKLEYWNPKLGAWLPYCIQFLLVPFTSLSEAWSLLSWIRIFFFEGGGGKGVGKAVQSFSLPSPLKGLPDCKIYSTLSLEKGQPDCKIELISPTAIGCQVHNRLRGKWSWIVSYDSFSFTVTRQTFVQRGDVLAFAYTKWYLIF